MEKRKQLFVAVSVYLMYVAVIAVSNVFMKMSVAAKREEFEMVSGILFGFIGIPVFSIILPIWLSKKWKLDFSFWPKTKKWLSVVCVLSVYTVIVNFESIKHLAKMDISAADFIIHYVSTLLFHVSYYPLFLLLLFPIFRKNFGFMAGVIATALSFSLYHFAHFHFFPAGLTPLLQTMLFLSFAVNILLYLWSESLMLVALVHSINGAVGLLANGSISNHIDFVFYLTVVIMGALFTYMIARTIMKKDASHFNAKWWIRTIIE